MSEVTCKLMPSWLMPSSLAAVWLAAVWLAAVWLVPVWLAAALPVVGLAQAPATPPGPQAPDRTVNFRLRRLDRERGLRHDQFNIFLGADRRGFHWIGSEAGAYRFDGQHLDRYAVGGARERYPEVMSDFFEDRRGHVWFTVSEGLVEYDPGTDRMHLRPLARDTLAMLDWELVAYDSAAHRLWVSNARHLLSVSAADGRVLTPPTPSRGARYCDAGTDGNRRLLLALPWALGPGLERVWVTRGGGVEVKPSADPIIARSTFNAGARDRAGLTWLASERGLVAYDPRADRHLGTVALPGALDPGVFAVEPYGAFLLVATDRQGVWVFDPARRRFWRKLAPDPDLGHTLTERPRDLHVDGAGVVLVSRAEGGVDVLVPRLTDLRRIVRPDGSPLLATELHPAGDGAIMAATAGGEVVWVGHDGRIRGEVSLAGEVLDADCRQFARAADGSLRHARRDALYTWLPDERRWRVSAAPARAVRSITTTAQGLVVETSQGLHCLDHPRLAIVPLPPCVGFRYLRWHADDRFLLSTASEWLREFRLVGDRVVASDSVRMPGEVLHAYVSTGARADTLVVCALDRSLRYLRRAGGTWLALDTLVEGVTIIDAVRDARGRRWLSTDEGLMCRGPAGWRRLTVDHGLPPGPAVPHGLQVADDGAIWGATRGGVYRLAPGASAAAAAEAGVLYLRRVWIDGRAVGPQAFAATDGGVPTLALAHGRDQLQVEVGLVGAYGTEPPEFMYRPAAPAADWRPLGSSGLLTLDGLAAGRHVFEVAATGANGERGEPIRLIVDKGAPLWQRAWFVALVALLVGGTAAGVSFVIYRRRLAEQYRRHERELILVRERERISRELHDDLGGDLSSILFLSDDDAPLPPDERARIAALSRGALRNMREIVWTLREDPVTTRELLGSLVSLVRERCGPLGIRVDVEVSSDLWSSETAVPAATSRHVFLFVKEAVTNVIKHATARAVRLSVSPSAAGTLCVEVADDGVGMPAEVRGGGSGMGNLRERAAALGGRGEVGAAPGGGTVLRLVLPWAPTPSEG